MSNPGEINFVESLSYNQGCFCCLICHYNQLQQKAREEREAKRSMIDFRHEYLINTVANTLGLTTDEVTESLLEGNQVHE